MPIPKSDSTHPLFSQNAMRPSFFQALKIGLLVATVLSAACGTALGGGITITRGKGNTYKPVQNDSVRIISGEVKIENGWSVSEHIVLENISDKKVQFKIAFPVQLLDDDGIGEKVRQQFKARVGKSSVQSGLCNANIADYSVLFADKKREIPLEIYCWDIVFQAKEKKEISVEYKIDWSSDIRYYPEQEFFYIMKTGAMWSGNVAKAVFSIQLPKGVKRALHETYLKYRLDIEPGGYKINGDLVEWVFVDWKPVDNININVVEESPSEVKTLEMVTSYYNIKQYDGDKRSYDVGDIVNKKIGGDYVPIKHGNMRRLNAKALRNEIYARHGRVFTSLEMKSIFESAQWYKPRSDFKETELNDTEKSNVQFIYEYERKNGWK